jgi:hypothetical protein
MKMMRSSAMPSSLRVLLAVSAAFCWGLPSWADDTEKIAALLAPAIERGGVITIPPGDYRLDGAKPLPISSHTTVFSHGARFHLPEQLGDKAKLVFFEGTDVQHFAWYGGEFIGHVFDPARRENAWEPNANTRVFLLNTTADGATHDVLFREVRSRDVAGAVISVFGGIVAGSESGVAGFADRIAIESCTLLRSGKFMWDYGYLWHQVLWPEDYEPWEVERAWKYFRTDLVREGVKMEDGGDRVRFTGADRAVAVSASDEPKDAICFYGGPLPRNIVRGRQYFVIEGGVDSIKIAEKAAGTPIKFEGASGEGAKLIHIVAGAFGNLYAPTGSGPGKGAFDLVACRDVRVTGCQLSALGDTMHIQRCHGVVFANNQILGSRMGAFFLAEFCKNAVITGNIVDATNGSRVISVEKSCEDVTMTGNTFRNGGRGSWINQPKNFVMTGNVFVNNTTKNERDPRRGRRSFLTGDYETKPELYFTLHEKDGSYGPIVVRDNIFALGAGSVEPTVTFAPGGKDLLFTGNIFRDRPATIRVDPSITDSEIGGNPGAAVVREPVDFNYGRR